MSIRLESIKDTEQSCPNFKESFKTTEGKYSSTLKYIIFQRPLIHDFGQHLFFSLLPEPQKKLNF
jgi:hypothetical protein